MLELEEVGNLVSVVDSFEFCSIYFLCHVPPLLRMLRSLTLKHLIWLSLHHYLLLTWRKTEFFMKVVTKGMNQTRVQKMHMYRLWRTLEYYGGNHDLWQRMQKDCLNNFDWMDQDTSGAIMIEAMWSLLSTEVCVLSLHFSMLLVNRDLLRVRQDCLPSHLILKTLSASPTVHH